MGCDGGTIPTRDELVKTKKKPEKRDKDADLAATWQMCALLQTPLERPIVACQLGRLYNKESVIEFLLEREKFDEEKSIKFNHIKALKDVKQLNLTDNPAYTSESLTGDAYADRCMSKFICPVTGLEMSGRFRFCYIWSCGCVVSERALKEVKSVICHKCGLPYEEDDVILLNGNHDEVDVLWVKMESRKQKLRAEKKAKKKKLDSTATSAGEAASSSKQPRLDTNGISLTKSKNGGGKTKSKTDKDSDKKKSIQHDPTASKVYKSLFTTCDKAKNQQKAHWVTFNPQYN
ncbi:replication termination factor 2-like [Tubulanus polymorphus]|uniref:replication termination factor 2-like n=1 Tax=Tubulanus polymorphus TaxID=672921 RepID=UPI003DA29773